MLKLLQALQSRRLVDADLAALELPIRSWDRNRAYRLRHRRTVGEASTEVDRAANCLQRRSEPRVFRGCSGVSIGGQRRRIIDFG
jgi:hypothetical protein